MCNFEFSAQSLFVLALSIVTTVVFHVRHVLGDVGRHLPYYQLDQVFFCASYHGHYGTEQMWFFTGGL